MTMKSMQMHDLWKNTKYGENERVNTREGERTVMHEPFTGENFIVCFWSTSLFPNLLSLFESVNECG